MLSARLEVDCKMEVVTTTSRSTSSNNSVEGGLQNKDGNNSKLQANTLGVDNNRTSCEIAILGKLEMDVEMGIVKTRITRFYLQNRANNRNIN